MNALTNLFDLNQLDLIEFFVNLGEKPFRAKQLLQWIHQRGVQDFSQMTDLSKNLRQRLAEIACIRPPEVVATQLSQDGTRKWLLKLDDHNCIETVFIPEEGRNTLCISSQVGCTLACRFCATGYQGFNRNLSVGEIIAQLWLVEHNLRAEGYPRVSEEEQRVISNVVLMGMGEPLTNFTSVVKAIQLMQDDFAYGLSWRRTTISTAGIVPALLRLKQHCTVGLAISLHAPTDELRNTLVPINRKYPLAQLLAACRDYVKEDSRRRITFEYVMLRNINDSPTHAKLLIKLLQGIPSKINLIPFNPFPNTIYQCSSLESIEEFRNILMSANLMTITRKTRGRDIDAACGQLAGKVQDRTRRTVVRQQETEGNPHCSITHP